MYGIILTLMTPRRSEDYTEEQARLRSMLAIQLGDRLRKFRKDLNLSQEELRARLSLESVNISRSRYSRIENGIQLPDVSEIIALSKVFKISLDLLLKVDDCI